MSPEGKTCGICGKFVNSVRERGDKQPKSALFQIDSAVYPGCYVENFSTTTVENSVETVEKPINKQVLHTFHRVFNRWKSGASSTLCINSAVSTRCKRHLHFWRILPGKLVKLPPHAPKSCKKR